MVKLVFPLSPKLAILLHPHSNDIDPYRELSAKEVEVLNESQVIQSSRQVFSYDGNFAFVDRARARYNNVRAYVENLAPLLTLPTNL